MHMLSMSCDHGCVRFAGIVLLKNRDATLPLDPRRLRRVVLVGPHANASDHLLGNYYGKPGRVITPLQAFQVRAIIFAYYLSAINTNWLHTLFRGLPLL